MTTQLRPITYKRPMINARGDTYGHESDQPGWFHQFQERNGQLNAVIETEFGEILILPTELIRFTNEPNQ